MLPAHPPGNTSRISPPPARRSRHGLEAFTFRHGQLANDVKSVRQFDGVLLALDDNFPISNLVNRHRLPRSRNYKYAFRPRCHPDRHRHAGFTVNGVSNHVSDPVFVVCSPQALGFPLNGFIYWHRHGVKPSFRPPRHRPVRTGSRFCHPVNKHGIAGCQSPASLRRSQ